MMNLFGLKKDLVDSLQPFRYQLDTQDQESCDESSESEAELEDEFEDLDLELATTHGTPFVLYTSPHIEEGKVMMVYKRWFNLEEMTPVQALKDLDPEGKSLVMLIGGGHFAAAIIQHKPKSLIRDKNNPFANIVISHHKSFHRYTTRRKQGGAQSASDNANGKANSAGSSIRRQNEMMLRQEVQQLLESWATEIKGCQRIFYHASGRTNKGIIVGWDPKCPIMSNDSRLRTIPLTTKRPTADEIKRIWKVLTTVLVQEAPALEPKIEPKRDKKIPSAPKSKTPPPENLLLTPEEQWGADVSNAIKKSNLTDLKNLLDEKLNISLEGGATPLILAARTGKNRVVAALLRWGADPTIKVSGKSLGDVAKAHPKVLETLQLVRKELGEVWNWDKANVGPAMTQDELDAQYEQLRRDKADAQMKAFEQEEKDQKNQQIEKLIKKHGSGRNLGGTKAQTSGLTEEEKRHIERERRARAAEARLKK